MKRWLRLLGLALLLSGAVETARWTTGAAAWAKGGDDGGSGGGDDGGSGSGSSGGGDDGGSGSGSSGGGDDGGSGSGSSGSGDDGGSGSGSSGSGDDSGRGSDDSGRGRSDDGRRDDDRREDRRDDRQEDEDDGDLRSLGRLFDRVFGEADREGRDRDVADHELSALGLDAGDRAALAAAGFRALDSHPLAQLGTEATRLAIPASMRLLEARTEARRLAPGAVIDYTDLYRAEGRPAACAEADCWPATLVAADDQPDGACARPDAGAGPGAAPVVALIDTGLDPGHPALAGAETRLRRFADGDPAPPDHGTAVAALLVGRPWPGAAPLIPGARLLAADVFAGGGRDGAPRADAVAILRALDWALASGAEVIVMPLAGGPSELLRFAVGRAARSADLAAAGGNDGPRGPAAYPAAFPEVVAVAAVDRRKRPWRGGTRGDYLEISAPGVEIASAAPGGGVQAWTGTSFAAPFAAAALVEAHAVAGRAPGAARARLAALAEDLGAPGRDPLTGHGLLRLPRICR